MTKRENLTKLIEISKNLTKDLEAARNVCDSTDPDDKATCQTYIQDSFGMAEEIDDRLLMVAIEGSG